MVATHGQVQTTISLNIPKSREEWVTWKIEFLAYPGANRFDRILNDSYLKLDPIEDYHDKKGDQLAPTNVFWQYHQKYENERDVSVQRAWNAILSITKAEHRHLIIPFLTETEIDQRVVQSWNAICDHMELKGVTMAKSTTMTKFNQLAFVSTGDFMKDVITFRNEINRLKLLLETMGVSMDDELFKNKFQLGLPDKHRGSAIVDVVLRNANKGTWTAFSDAIIGQLQQMEILYEAKASIAPKNKVDEKLQQAKGEVTTESKQLAALRKDLRRAKSRQKIERGGKGKQGKGDKSLFSGDCYVCGKRGHKAQDCRLRNKQTDSNLSQKGEQGQSSVTKCPICKRMGHTEDKCWFNKKMKRDSDGDSQTDNRMKRGKRNEGDDDQKFKGQAFITFKDGSRTLLKPGQFGIPESDDE